MCGFLWREFSVEREISGGELSRGIFTLGDLTKFLYEILFVLLTFFLTTQFCMRRCSEGIVCAKFSVVFNFW